MVNWLEHFANRQAKMIDHDKYRHFSLFVPLIKIKGEDHLIFEVRSKHIPQPGEVCFPGGRVDDSDDSNKAAAIRELCEELGIDEKQVSVIGELDYLITPYRFIIHPFLGRIEEGTSFNINKTEVEEIFTIPLSKLKEMKAKKHDIALSVQPDEKFPYDLIPNGESYNWRRSKTTELFYEYEGYVIWGLTARVLTHFIDELKKVDQSQ